MTHLSQNKSALIIICHKSACEKICAKKLSSCTDFFVFVLRSYGFMCNETFRGHFYNFEFKWDKRVRRNSTTDAVAFFLLQANISKREIHFFLFQEDQKPNIWYFGTKIWIFSKKKIWQNIGKIKLIFVLNLGIFDPGLILRTEEEK